MAVSSVPVNVVRISSELGVQGVTFPYWYILPSQGRYTMSPSVSIAFVFVPVKNNLLTSHRGSDVTLIGILLLKTSVREYPSLTKRFL